LQEAAQRPEAEEILDRIADSFKSDVVIVDVTGADLVKTHIAALKRGFHVVTANKRPLSTELKDYQSIQAIRRKKGLNYQHEATFGAGLPLLSTLQDLIQTGDTILEIKGCLSGTLGFICSRLDQEVPFSEAVREAMDRGFTEPDPRDDLSGLDVARKALIIARELGAPLEMADVKLKPMIPKRFFRGRSVADFMAGLKMVDPFMRKEYESARKSGKVLRFLANIDAGGCSVGLHQMDKDSPVGRLAGPDNILVFRTIRYDENPLVIQGPGAGASVTAAGVLSDLLKIAKWI
jgi:bifunctional aspartokinase / homoserine dehydrogenase 1